MLDLAKRMFQKLQAHISITHEKFIFDDALVLMSSELHRCLILYKHCQDQRVLFLNLTAF